MRAITRLCLAVLLMLSVPAAVLAAPPLSVSGQTSPVAFLDTSTNNLYVFGTITCTKHAEGGVRAVVTQGAVERAGELSLTCSGKPTPWLITLTDDGLGQYTPGPATLAIGFSANRGSEAVVTGREEPIFIVGF